MLLNDPIVLWLTGYRGLPQFPCKVLFVCVRPPLTKTNKQVLSGRMQCHYVMTSLEIEGDSHVHKERRRVKKPLEVAERGAQELIKECLCSSMFDLVPQGNLHNTNALVIFFSSGCQLLLLLYRRVHKSCALLLSYPKAKGKRHIDPEQKVSHKNQQYM